MLTTWAPVKQFITNYKSIDMTKVQEKNEIRAAIEDYCGVKGISRNELSVQIGVSGATLSNMCNEKWSNIDDRMWLKVWNFVKPNKIDSLYNTSDFAAIQKLCTQAKSNHIMVSLIGDTGMGKTVALEALSRRENTFYIYYNSSMRPRHFFYELGKLLGYDFDGSMYDMINKVCDTLNSMDEPLIMIDEAGKLSDTMLMHLHILRDRTMHNCGILLAGMPYFKSNLEKKAVKQKVGMSEFMRRVSLWHELAGLSREEIKFVCGQHGITSPSEVKEFTQYRRFGDLSNAILLHNTINS